MFQRIVVPLDGSGFAEAALAPARELARTFGARIVVVRAVPPHGVPDTIGGDGAQSDVERADEADAYLHASVRRLRAAGYSADLALALAAPGAGIAQAVTLEDADVVVMAAHLRWKVPASPSISTTLDLLVHSRVPVLVWRNTLAEDAARLTLHEAPLIVPLDGSARSEGALPYAETLAHSLRLYVVLVRVVTHPDLKADAAAYLAQVQERLERTGIPTTTRVRIEDDPLGGIEEAWRETAGGLIVMASRGRTGPHGTFFGSLAARLIEEVEAPILVIRPQTSMPSATEVAVDVQSADDSAERSARSGSHPASGARRVDAVPQ